MNLCRFLNLPDVIVLDIFNDWLKLADVGHLDSAVCSEKARPQFLTILSAYRVFVDNMRMTNLKEYQILVWAMNRAVEVCGFTVSSQLLSADDALLDDLVSRNGSSILWLALEDCDNAEMLARRIAKLAQSCFNTETLCLESCALPTSLCDEYYPQLTQAFNRLHTLHIKKSKISSNGLANMLQHCTMLKRLHMGSFISPLPVEVALPSLEQFSARDCDITEAVLFAIAANCPHMKHMDIFRNAAVVTEAAVRAILQGCPLLQYTDVEYARGLGHELCVELTRRRNFTQLVFFLNTWTYATPELCKSLFCVSPNLLWLVVYLRPWLTDDVLAVCAQHCRSLKCLILNDCRAVTVTGILAITAPGHKLNDIVLEGCTGLDDEAVLAVAQRCPHLKEFTSPPQVSSEAIVALAQGCPLLEVVCLNGTIVEATPGTAIEALAQNCPQLRAVNCPGVTQQAMAELHHCFPKLTLQTSPMR